MLDFLLIYSRDNIPLSFNKLDIFINNQIDDCSFDYKQACYFFSERKDRFALFCSTTIESHLIHKNADVNFFDGIIIQDEACIDIRTLKPILDKDATDHSWKRVQKLQKH